MISSAFERLSPPRVAAKGWWRMCRSISWVKPLPANFMIRSKGSWASVFEMIGPSAKGWVAASYGREPWFNFFGAEDLYTRLGLAPNIRIRFRIVYTSSEVSGCFWFGFNDLAWASHERYCHLFSSIKTPLTFKPTTKASSIRSRFVGTLHQLADGYPMHDWSLEHQRHQSSAIALHQKYECVVNLELVEGYRGCWFVEIVSVQLSLMD